MATASHQRLREQLVASLAGTRPPADLMREAKFGVHGDVPPELAQPDTVKPAAVLVPIVDHADGLTVMLTLRTDHLPDHPGQIAFPGGSFEPQDSDLVVTALREMEEEVGVAPESVEIAGFLPPYLTITGFAVAPVVGLVRPDYQPRPDPYEVAEVFEVPLAHVIDTANHRIVRMDVRGHDLAYYQIDWQGYRIWGATAAMLVGLSQRLQP